MSVRRTRRTLVVALLAALAVLGGLNVSPTEAPVAAAAPSAFCLPPLIPCAPPPEPSTNVTGFAFPNNTVSTPVRGFLQTHNHQMSYLGFGQGPFCGKTFDPGGISKAMVDCPEHMPFGIPAWFEQLASGQPILSQHSTEGWPTFRDFPKPNSATHNQTYYKGLERAWKAGLRVYVNDLVTNRGLCLIYTTTRQPCDEMTGIRAEAKGARDLEAYVDQQNGGAGKGWYRIVTTPQQARQVIAAGKLAVILGIETSEPFGCSKWLGQAQCTQADIDRGLDEVYALGVRSMFLCHKYDNALCGVRFDGGTNGVVVNVGNLVTSGQFWQAQTCTGPHHDNTIAAADAGVLAALLANARNIIQPVTLPIYPAAPHCNINGLTSLGEYALRGMMSRGMIVEVDHMSAKAADSTLDILEAANYSGVISSHDWMDQGYYPRVLQLGGLITPIAEAHGHTIDVWRRTNAAAAPNRIAGFGFGLDQNGLHLSLPAPGQSPAISYPFTSYDGAATLSKQVWGQRTWDFNTDGLAQEGMTPDWLQAVRQEAGADQARFVEDMTNGAEAYLRMWTRVSH